ncbi:hypothetical protein CRG98_024181 [Punica granatum]|uniref:Uncharacterized protein n=1 Tax=Punica granatum TaxID=22663 RepID=A0A2I0JGN1_PUNGR|nr:hypothetical protein CRG98_024181 [Punica granatum]
MTTSNSPLGVEKAHAYTVQPPRTPHEKSVFGVEEPIMARKRQGRLSVLSYGRWSRVLVAHLSLK